MKSTPLHESLFSRFVKYAGRPGSFRDSSTPLVPRRKAGGTRAGSSDTPTAGRCGEARQGGSDFLTGLLRALKSGEFSSGASREVVCGDDAVPYLSDAGLGA